MLRRNIARLKHQAKEYNVWFDAELAAERTAGFWHDSKEEFIAKTWHPSRLDWVLDVDELRMIREETNGRSSC